MSVIHDVRHAVRHLRQSPGFTLATVLTFAVAIGSNSAIFSAVNTVLLRPLAVSAPERLAVVWQTDEGGQAVIELTHRHLREWSDNSATFTSAAVMGSHNWSAVLQGRGEPTRLWFTGVSGAFFDTLGVQAMLGRTLRPSDDVPNGPSVAVLNHGTWVRRFGSDPNVVGTRMTLDGDPVEIVGVMPEGVDFPRGAEFWIPIVPMLAQGTPPNISTLETLGVFYVVGRLRPGLAMSSVGTEVNATEARLDAGNPGRLKWGTTAVVTPFVDYVFGPVRPALRVLWVAVAVLLLIACANVSGLLLTRVARKRNEQSIRMALGATRGTIARLWLTETLVVASIGGVLGVAVAYWLARGIVALAPDDLPRVGEIAVNAPVALFTLGVVVAVALLTAVVPLLQAGRTDVTQALDGTRATSSRSALHARSALLVVQIALSVVLMVAAGLVVRSFAALTRVDLGFQSSRVLSATVQPRTIGGPPNAWIEQLLARVRAQPGVEAAGAIYLRPLMLGPIGQGVLVRLEGQPETREASQSNPTLNHQIASVGYFEAMHIRLRAGRFFNDRDTRESARVALVAESTARRLWPGQDPIGKRLSMSSFTPGAPRTVWRTIVGVVSDVRYRGLQEVQLDVYDAALQTGRPADNIVVRTSGDPMVVAPTLRAIARELDPGSIIDSVTTLDAVVERAEAPWRLTMWMFVLFAALAFTLAGLGLFALVALDVAQRQREFAIRLALGATRRAILNGVIGRAGWRVGAGALIGVATAFAASRVLRGLLFGVAPDDALTYALVLTLLLVAAAVAAIVPARRAARVDPQTLLRLAAAGIACASLTMMPAAVQPEVFDLLVRNGTVFDGSGGPGRRADVGVRGDRIAAVADLAAAQAKTIVDATGQAVTPGFINMLSWSTESLLVDGRSQGEIRQGVTTQIFGEGSSMGPLNPAMKTRMVEQMGDLKFEITWTTLSEYLQELERRGVSQNVASFLGATTVREHAIGLEDRKPTPAELQVMREIVRREMEAGALGIGSSLIYAPAFYATTEELVELCKVAAQYRGKYISHIRSEGNRLVEAVEELLRIAREAKIPAEIYHLKAAGEKNWPKLTRVIELVEAARRDGLKITADMYTYPAGATGLDASMPPWVLEGGYEAAYKRLRDPETRKKIAAAIRTPSSDWENLYLAAGSAERVLLVEFKSEALKPLTGRTLASVASARGEDPVDTIMNLVLEDRSRVGTVYFMMSEENLRRQIRLPWISFGSDAASMAPEPPFTRSSAHPRAYGNFARLLGRYVRDEQIITLADAVHRLSGLPATNLELRDRGFLKAGMFADVVVFDPKTIADTATFEQPHQFAVGVRDVVVNGVPVLANGQHTGAKPGKAVWGVGRK